MATNISVTTNGKERALYSFKGNPDGANPTAALTDLNGRLYGTTSEGGLHGGGTVFSITAEEKNINSTASRAQGMPRFPMRV